MFLALPQSKEKHQDGVETRERTFGLCFTKLTLKTSNFPENLEDKHSNSIVDVAGSSP